MFFKKNEYQQTQGQSSLLILQEEAVLLKFEPRSSLPINLETTNVADCLCVIVYSSEKGIAYLSHIFMKSRLDALKCLKTISEIVQDYQLDSHNTFVALVGGQSITCQEIFNDKDAEIIQDHKLLLRSTSSSGFNDKDVNLSELFDLSHKYSAIIEDYQLLDSNTFVEKLRNKDIGLLEVIGDSHSDDRILGVLAVKKCMNVWFNNIYEDIGGESKGVSRSIELSAFALKHINVYYTSRAKESNQVETNTTLSFHQHEIPIKVTTTKQNLFDVMYHSCDIGLKKTFTQINYDKLQTMLSQLESDRFRRFDPKTLSQLKNSTVFQLTSSFGKSKICTSVAMYDCATLKPQLFWFIKNNSDFDRAVKLDYPLINVLRLKPIQKLIQENKLTIQLLENITPFALAVFHNKSHYTFLLKNMDIVEILKLTADDVRICETLKKLDEISSDKNLSFRPSKLTFAELDKFYEEKQTKITIPDSDSDEESESMLGHTVSCTIS